jgi:crotonobetainyl-CoA:carnitine CoA-transferase CaiB-like acyl-CoA transferase
LVLFDGDNERLGLVTEYEHPLMGRMRQFGNLVDFSDTPGRIAGPPPMVGEHTREILAGLGYDEAEIDELRREGVVTWPSPDTDYPWAV